MRSLWLSIPISLFILSLQPESAQQQSVAKELLEGKCTLCHTSQRIFTTDTQDLNELVARMTAKNPDWFRKTDSRHLLESLETMLNFETECLIVASIMKDHIEGVHAFHERRDPTFEGF